VHDEFVLASDRFADQRYLRTKIFRALSSCGEKGDSSCTAFRETGVDLEHVIDAPKVYEVERSPDDVNPLATRSTSVHETWTSSLLHVRRTGVPWST